MRSLSVRLSVVLTFLCQVGLCQWKAMNPKQCADTYQAWTTELNRIPPHNVDFRFCSILFSAAMNFYLDRMYNKTRCRVRYCPIASTWTAWLGDNELTSKMAQLFKYQRDGKLKEAVNKERIRVFKRESSDSWAPTQSVFSPYVYDRIQADCSDNNTKQQQQHFPPTILSGTPPSPPRK